MRTDIKYNSLNNNDVIQNGDEYEWHSKWEKFLSKSIWIGGSKNEFSLNVRRKVKYKYNKFDSNEKPNWQ